MRIFSVFHRRLLTSVCAALAAGLMLLPASAPARARVFLACGNSRRSAPTLARVAPARCAMRAYDTSQLTYVDVEFRHLTWKGWGSSRPIARGQ